MVDTFHISAKSRQCLGAQDLWIMELWNNKNMIIGGWHTVGKGEQSQSLRNLLSACRNRKQLAPRTVHNSNTWSASGSVAGNSPGPAIRRAPEPAREQQSQGRRWGYAPDVMRTDLGPVRKWWAPSQGEGEPHLPHLSFLY